MRPFSVHHYLPREANEPYPWKAQEGLDDLTANVRRLLPSLPETSLRLLSTFVRWVATRLIHVQHFFMFSPKITFTLRKFITTPLT